MKRKTDENGNSAFFTRSVPPAILRLIALFILLAVFFTLFSCSLIDGISDAIGEAVRELTDLAEGESVLDFVGDGELPSFDRKKFRTAEQVFDRYSVYDYSDKEPIAERMMEFYRGYYAASVDASDATAVTDALLYCFVAALGDRYAFYRTAPEYVEYSTDMSGRFYGVGIYVHYDAEAVTVTVSEVYEGSPAEAAGMRAGDMILAVDGAALTDIGYDELINRVRGEEGTEVTLTILRDGEEMTVTAVRGAINEKSASYRIIGEGEGAIGYVTIRSFKDNTADQFAAAYRACLDAGVVGLIFDLRDNPGGYLNAVIRTISYLVPDGTEVVSFGDYDSPAYAEDGEEEDMVLALPCVVLCNENTASAGELFTSAVRDYATEAFGLLTAKTVGTNTFGKGIMQSTYTFSDRSAVTLTTAFYYPPSRVNYHDVGIAPDVPVEDDPDTEADEQYVAALAVLTGLIAQ